MVARLPNLFILGAGRCGTSTLHAALAEHPQVFMSQRKEPTFFSEPFQVIRNPIRYAQLFEGVGDELVVGESSHAYLSHPEAAKTLRAFFPDPRFIIIVRNPADRALAMYSYMIENGNETLAPFEKALAAEDARFASERFARRCPHYFWNFMYYRSGLFGEQTARYFDLFDRHRFHFTTLYDLIDRPDEVLRGVHDFLEIDDVKVPKLPHAGSSKGVRSIRLQYFERTVVRRAARRSLPGMEWLRKEIRIRNRGTKPTMEPGTRAQLIERFRPDLERFADLTGVDVLQAEVSSKQTGG